MDFQSMKRKQLQALCKKHSIPANLTNLEMAKNLASLLKEKEKPMAGGRSCLKDMGEIFSKNDSKRQFKKVRFSPENETIEFVDSRAARRRKSITKPMTQKWGLVVSSTDGIEVSNGILEDQVRITRSRAQKLVSAGAIEVVAPVVEKKRKRMNGERSDTVEGDDGERGNKTDFISDLSDNLVSESTDAEEIRVQMKRPLRNREIPISKKSEEAEKDCKDLKNNQNSLKQKNVETNDKISKDTGLERERKIVQPERTLRRSKRRVRNIEDCGQLSRASVENEIAGRGRKARSKTLLVDNASGLESEIRTETKVEVHGKPEEVVRLEEPIRSRGINSARQKSVVPQIEEVENNGHKVENESRKQLRNSVLEDETRSEKLEGNDMRSRRRTRNKSISDGLDPNGNHNRKNGLRKRNRDPSLEEIVLTEGGTLEEPPPRRSTRNATKTDTTVQNKKLPSRLNVPNLEKLEPLAKSNAFKMPPVLDAEVSKPEITESAVLNSSKPPSISAANDMKEFGEKFLSKEVSVETFAIEEVKPPDMANLVEIGASKSVRLKTDYAEKEPLVSVSDFLDEKKPPEDDTSTNEDDLESHSCKRSTELESSILVEPEEDFNVPIDVGFPQVTVGADGYLVIDLTDCMALPSDNFDIWKETERDEEQAIRQCIDPSCSVAHHGVDDDKASAVKEQNLLEHKDSDNVGEAVEPESLVDDHLVESNESESTIVADLYNRERTEPTNMEDRDTDEAEKSAAGAEEQEPVICILRTQNNEMESLFTKSISACKGLSVTYGLSELEVADGTSNSTLSSSSKLSAYTNERGKGSSRNSSLKKQHHLIEACTGSADFNDIRGLMMVNSEKITPASKSVKLQCDSAEQEVQIPATEPLVVTEKENIVLVAGNQYLFQGDMHPGNKFDLVSQSEMKIGGFDDEDNIPNADVNVTTFRAVGFSPLLQAEHVVKPSSMLTLGGHLEAEKLVSGIYTQSGGFTKADYAAEDDKIHVLEVQNIIEFQEDCRFSRQNKQSTQKRVCEGHSTGPGESESSGEDCAITSKNAAKMRTSAPLHGERISPNMVERNNNEAELVENISSSNVETAKVVPEEMTNFQTTISYCTPLNSPECEESRFTRPALTIAEGHTNLLEVEERSKYGNQFHQGIMSDSNTSKSDTKDKMCRQKKSVALADNETMSEGPLCVERASRPVNDETGYEHLEGNSFKGHVSSLNELDDLLTGENENAGSETDSKHHYKNIEEPSMSILTNEKRILIWVERNTDQTRDRLAPIRGPESSVLVNNETSSECTPLKDENETGQEFKTLFATPASSASPSDDSASSHETETSDARIQESSPICTVKNRRLNHGEPGNFLGLTENRDENMAYERNVSQTSSKEVAGEGSDGSADVEFTGVDCSSYSAFDLFTSNDVHVDDKESDGSRNCGNASKEDRSVEVLPLRVGAGIDPIILEKKTDQTEYSKEAGDRQECIAKSHTTQSGLEYHAFGAIAKELSVGALRLSGDIEMQDEGMRSSSDDLENVPAIQSATVTKVNNHDMSIKGDLNVKYSKLVTKKKDAENFPRVGIWDSNGCKDRVPQVNGRSHAGSAETASKESKVSEEKITAGFEKSTSKSVSGTKVLKEGEEESVLAPFGELGIGKVVLDHGVEYGTSDAKGVDASGILSDKDAKQNVIFNGTKAALEHKDSDGFLMENRERVMHNNDELNVDKNEVVAELEKSNSDALLNLANRKEDEHVLEVPNELAGTKLQVKEMKLHDFHCHKNCAIMEGDLDVIDGNSYAEEDVSPGCSDNCWEHEKILGKAGCSELNVSDNDGQGSQCHVSQRDLSSDAERREVSEIEEVDLFDDFGFTVSSCVPINCKEDRGNTCSSMDKSFQEDKDEGKEKKVGEISNHFAVCAIDDSNVEEYIKCEAKVSKEQLVCSEDALAGYHGTMRCGALELSLESTMFSSWEINLYLGDEVRNSEISVTDFTREDSDVASLSRENGNVILPEEQFGRHNQLMEENVREPKSSCYVSEEAIFEGDEVLEEKDSANMCIGCSYSEKGVVEVEKSMIPIDDGILRKASNFEGCASVDMRVEEGGFKSWEGEAATELCENAIKYNPAMEFQPSRYDLAVDGGTASAEEDSQQIWEPRSELLRKEGSSNSAIKLLNSTTIKRKNADTSWIQGTPLKKLMKENEPSIKRQNLGGTTVRSMTNRRALEDLQNH